MNPAAGKILEEKYMTIVFNDCRSHCTNLLIEDIARILEIKELVADCQKVVKFVWNHQHLKDAYTRVADEHGGTQLKVSRYKVLPSW